MFRNLEAEMVLKGFTQGTIAKQLGITPTTLSFKLNGKSPISLQECVDIKKIIGTDKSIEELFAIQEEKE